MVEDCKAYAPDEVCPFDADPARSPCDCDWRDPWGRVCDKFSVRTRALQKMWFVCQARDYDPVTGARTKCTSFPEFDFNPISTKWWTNSSDLPGAEAGINASGYETTYDRLRVISALQTISIPLYNYYTIPGYQGSRTSMSSYFAFEADGGYFGYSGCNYDASRYAQFKSSEENGAYLISPDLCPMDKYGYDPRCRPWYSETKQKSLWQGNFVHVMAPYRFATADTVGTTACSGVVDPETGEYVGTTAIDLSPTDLFDNLNTVDADFYFVISPDDGNDTVVGPSHNLNSDPDIIANVVLPYDKVDSKNRRAFTNITSMMKAGQQGVGRFERKSLEGESKELFISFAPVSARVLKAIQPNTYTRGVETSSELWYSLGIVKAKTSLETDFNKIEDAIDSSLATTAIIFVSSVAAITFLCILVTAKVMSNRHDRRK
jgi:hypothetical protein